MRSLLAGMLALAAASIVVIAPANAGASTIHVDTTADSGLCSLRNAITAANTNAVAGTCAAGGSALDTIDFVGVGGPKIILASTLPPISSSMVIAGPGAGTLMVDGNNVVQPFRVDAGTSTISGLTIANGRCGPNCGSEGGAIFESGGDLTLDSDSLTGNTAIDATAVAGSNFAEGGAIEVQAGSTLHVVNSALSGNTVSVANASMQNGASAGGIMDRGTVIIDRSTLSGNQATGVAAAGASSNVAGGAIDNDGHLTITRSTLSGNSVTASGAGSANGSSGGAIGQFNNPADSLQIDRSTIVGNTITSTAGTTGGGIYSIGGPATITSSTISGNSASTGANLVIGAPTTLSNSIVSNPQVGPNCNASVISTGYNIESANACGLNQASDHPSTAPMLDALADNGGPTQTRAPQAGSPASDQARAAAGETVDQRGLIRPSDIFATANFAGGDGSDIGAVEIQDTVAPDTAIDSGPDEGSTIADPAPTFAFSSTETDSHFECSVDSAAFGGCASPDALGPLPDGAHSFAVRAIDGTGNTDATPASRSFTVAVPPVPPPASDTTAPETTITKEPKAKSSKSKAKYNFISTEPNSTFECAFDSKQFKPCNSGKVKYKHLDFGKHKFTVVATDAAGNTDPSPAKDKFKRKH